MVPFWAFGSIVRDEVAKLFTWKIFAHAAVFDTFLQTAFDEVAVHVV